MRLDTISLSALSRGFAIVLAVSAFLLAFAMGLGWRQVAQLQVDLETVAAQTEAKTVWFATLQRTLGYGGLIHQFEELVLRRDPALVEETQAHLDRARAAIGAYAAEGLSQREMALVEDLNSVLGNYEKSLATVTGLLADGASSPSSRARRCPACRVRVRAGSLRPRASACGAASTPTRSAGLRCPCSSRSIRRRPRCRPAPVRRRPSLRRR